MTTAGHMPIGGLVGWSFRSPTTDEHLNHMAIEAFSPPNKQKHTSSNGPHNRRLCSHVKARWAERGLVVFVDNCYGEFVEDKEPCHVGADLIAGSLIKNPGGTIAKSGERLLFCGAFF